MIGPRWSLVNHTSVVESLPVNNVLEYNEYNRIL